MARLACPRSRAACRMWIMAESAPSFLTNIGYHHHHPRPHQHHCQLIIGFSNSTFIFINALMTLLPCWTTRLCTQEQKALTLSFSSYRSVLTSCAKHTFKDKATDNGPIIQGKSDHRSLKCPHSKCSNTFFLFPPQMNADVSDIASEGLTGWKGNKVLLLARIYLRFCISEASR